MHKYFKIKTTTFEMQKIISSHKNPAIVGVI